MNSGTPDLVGQAGLTYFGRTTAAISHELKNALAIIKENAGLLNDYLLMSDKGAPIDPLRFKTVAARIEDQTRRADTIIRNMNRFAHSVDDPLQSVNLNDITALLIVLSQREAAMRQVTLSFMPTAGTVMVTTAPYLLLTLLGHCLTFALRATTPGRTIILQVDKIDAGAQIRFEGLKALADLSGETFPGESETALLTALGATLAADRTAGRATVTLFNR